MNTISPLMRLSTVGGLVAGLITGGCALVAPRAERWTPPPVGSSWEVAQHNTGSYGKDVVLKFTRGDGVWRGVPAITIANSLGSTIMVAPNGHWMAILGRDGKASMSWDPPLGFEYPMSVGQSWVSRHQMTLGASGKTLSYDLACKTESREKVTVKAGTFDTFKVVCSTTIGNEETFWTHPDMGVFVKTHLRRTEKSPLGPGTQEAELLSAPSMSR